MFVAAGGQGDSSVDILNLQTMEWRSGPNLPRKFTFELQTQLSLVRARFYLSLKALVNCYAPRKIQSLLIHSVACSTLSVEEAALILNEDKNRLTITVAGAELLRNERVYM